MVLDTVPRLHKHQPLRLLLAIQSPAPVCDEDGLLNEAMNDLRPAFLREGECVKRRKQGSLARLAGSLREQNGPQSHRVSSARIAVWPAGDLPGPLEGGEEAPSQTFGVPLCCWNCGP